MLAIEQLVPRDLDHRVDRQGVDDADPDTMEAARRRIGLAFELPARMEHRHDDFERRLAREVRRQGLRSEEHTSELQSLMRISYAVFCLKKKTSRQRENHLYLQQV